MVLKPELCPLTLVTGLELTVLLQTGVRTFYSGPVLQGTKSSDPYLKQDSQFRSCDQGQEHKFRSKNHRRGLEFRSFCQGRGLMFRSFDQGEEREGGEIKMIGSQYIPEITILDKMNTRRPLLTPTAVIWVSLNYKQHSSWTTNIEQIDWCHIFDIKWHCM